MKLALAFVLALALPACAAASGAAASRAEDGGSGEGSSFGREGGYVSGALVKGVERFDESGKGVSGKGVDFHDGNIGYAVRGGWRTSGNFAVEASVERVDSYTIQAATARQDLDFSTLSFSGKYFLLDGRIQPYITAGVGWAWVNVPGPGTGANAGFYRGGVGGDVYITEAVALFAEANYDWMTGDLRNLDHLNLMAGVMIRF